MPSFDLNFSWLHFVTTSLQSLISEIDREVEDLFGFENKEGTYWHILTRVKEARQYGMLTIDDFEEVTIDDLQDIKNLFRSKLKQVLDEIIKTAPEERELISCMVKSPQHFENNISRGFNEGRAQTLQVITDWLKGEEV